MWFLSTPSVYYVAHPDHQELALYQTVPELSPFLPKTYWKYNFQSVFGSVCIKNRLKQKFQSILETTKNINNRQTNLNWLVSLLCDKHCSHSRTIKRYNNCSVSRRPRHKFFFEPNIYSKHRSFANFIYTYFKRHLAVCF